MLVREWLMEAQGRLAAAGVESASLDAQLLAAHVLLKDRSWILAHGDAEFPALAGESVLQRRERREPLAYILGYREFYGRRFSVRPGVLIPRQETEALIEAALDHAKPGGSLLDLGTGSGCIAVTVKLEDPSLRATAVDISESALGIAGHNAEELGADVNFIRSDGFGALLGEVFDLIVTNPPYIGSGEPLMPEVGKYEPSEALFSGSTGLEFYEMLADDAGGYIVEGGKLLMEVGYAQAAAVRELFEAKGWALIEIRKDLGGIDRVVVVQPVWVCATS